MQDKQKKIRFLLVIGAILALALGTLTMQSVRNGAYAQVFNEVKASFSGSDQLAQVNLQSGARAQRAADQAAEQNLLPAPSLDTPATQQQAANNVKTSGANCTGNACQFDNPLGQTGSLETFLNKLLDVIILIGSIAVVLSIIMAGLKYVTAQGDEGQIESAHKQLTWTVIGAAILLGAKVIAMVVQNTVKALA